MSKNKSVEKQKTGRKPKFNPEMNSHAEQLAARGFTDEQVAEQLGIHRETLATYKKQYPMFSASLKRGRQIADNKVVEALFIRATGYSHPSVDVRNVDGKIERVATIKHYPPDIAAIIFWLKNRLPVDWQDKRQYNFGDVDDPELAKKLTKKVCDALTKAKSKNVKSRFDNSKK